MAEQGILEVLTPPLSQAANTDPQVESLVVMPDAQGSGSSVQGHARYLHTSPEFAMKRVLCAYPDTDIYQMTTVYRAEVQGRFHVSQFTMLEWYRTGIDHLQLMHDTESLLGDLWQHVGLDRPQIDKRSYCQEVFERLGAWPDDLDGYTVRDYFNKHDRSFPAGLEDDLNACLDLFIDEFILPEFHPEKLTFLFDYPVAQAALARVGVDAQGRRVAQRFEVFFGKLELANGFHELNDAGVQRQRFEAEQRERQIRGLQSVPLDERLLDALKEGLPDCAGIAMGVERLHMVLGKHAHINQVLVFCDDNA